MADKSGTYVSEEVGDIADKLKDKNIIKVFHNALFDVYFITSKGYEVNNYTDTIVMSQMISGKYEKHSLNDVAIRELGIELDKEMQSPDKWRG